MGLLDDLIGGALGGTLGNALGGQSGQQGGTRPEAVPHGSLAKPLIIALLALLASGALSRKSPPASGTAPPPAPTGAGDGGGLLGGLGGLLDQFQKGGLGEVVDSWIGRGQNRAVSPQQLGQAIDPDIVRQLSQRTGMSADDVLHQLSQVLPGLVDELSPQGRLPTHEAEDPRLRELSRLSESMR